MGSASGVSFWVLDGGGRRPVGYRQVVVGSYRCIAAASRGAETLRPLYSTDHQEDEKPAGRADLCKKIPGARLRMA